MKQFFSEMPEYLKTNLGTGLVMSAAAFIAVLVIVSLLASAPEFRKLLWTDHAQFRTYGISILAIVGIGLAVWRSIIAQSQARTAAAQLSSVQAGHALDRFGKAFDKLESDDLAIRLGAISLLGRLLHDENWKNPEDVCSILCAFIRTNAPGAPTSTTEEADADGTDAKPLTTAPPPEDIQQALTVLTEFQLKHPCRVNLYKANLIEAYLIEANLIEANLSGANLSGAYLREANLIEAYLIEANLFKADLFKANLIEANLREANLSGANLIEAYLIEANLFKADLFKANLIEANLREANLREANLREANLSGANLIEANLIEANLFKADLFKANLIEANLREANLREANLIEANLSGANLSEANLSEANLSEANLSEANLREANLSEADCRAATFLRSALQSADLRNVQNLTQSQINAAYGNQDTKLPEGLTVPPHWLTGEDPPDEPENLETT